MKKLIKWGILGLTYLALFAIIVSYISIWINPASFWIPAIFGLLYPYLLVVNIILLIFWSWRKKPQAILILLILILGYGHFRNNFQVFGRSPGKVKDTTTVAGADTFSILSYNVRLFNYYEASPVQKSHTFIIDLVKKNAPGIVCLQEVLIQDPPGFSEYDLKTSLNNYPSSHLVFNAPKGYSRQYGVAIFTKFPIIRQGEIPFDNTHNQCIFADLVIGSDTIRIYNTHLQSLQLGTNNFKFITEFERNTDDEAFNELQDISLLMKRALIKRSHQARALSDHIQSSPYPVIVCGDFNDTPVSYVYHRIRKGLRDAFVQAGRGLGKTYSQIFPSYRIDYILYSPGIRASQFRTIRVDYSDHFPVSATLSKVPKR